MSVVEWVILLGILGAIAVVLVPNFIKARKQGSGTACKSNLKNIGTAMEMYSTDWSGFYPRKASLLTPNYLKTFPECPPSGTDTYSQSLELVRIERGLTLWCPRRPCPVEECKERRKSVQEKLESYREKHSALPLELTELELSAQELSCPGDEDHSLYRYRPYTESYRFCCQGDNHTPIGIPANYPRYNGIDGLIER